METREEQFGVLMTLNEGHIEKEIEGRGNRMRG
jgi:hypothetical protein